MRQVVIRRKKILVEDIPRPSSSPGTVEVRVIHSCISSGTERSVIESHELSLIQKVLARPYFVLCTIASHGVWGAYTKLHHAQEKSFPMGYSVSGVIEHVGVDVHDFSVGDHVAVAGLHVASHAEYIVAPRNLIARIPQGVDFESASTVALGSIALHAVHRMQVGIGDLCAVYGTGSIGILIIQILKSAGCRVIGIDVDDDRLTHARTCGAEFTLNPIRDDIINCVRDFSGGHGIDMTVFAAHTSSSDALHTAFKITRRKGRVVLVGVAGDPMTIPREDFYKKEIDFVVSTSYGPGRYDDDYEKEGIDYPYAYVRWTEQRNMQEYLRLLANGSIRIQSLWKDSIYSVEDAIKAFEIITQKQKPFFVILEYSSVKKEDPQSAVIALVSNNKYKKIQSGLIRIGIIGASACATTIHLPIFSRLKGKFCLQAVASTDGVHAKNVGRQWGASYVTTSCQNIIDDPDIDLVLIASRHNTHAQLALQALRAGKHVFVEKPMAITEQQLDSIEEYYGTDTKKPLLFVGFNRRHSPHIKTLKAHIIQRSSPLFVQYRMNAGSLPSDHWIYKEGGRIIGEACHIVDLFSYLVGFDLENVSYEYLKKSDGRSNMNDTMTATFRYADGSLCVMDYITTGSTKYPKEYCEIHVDGKTFIMDDYKILRGYGSDPIFFKTRKSQKGHKEQWEEIHAIFSESKAVNPTRISELLSTHRITIRLANDNKGVCVE